MQTRIEGPLCLIVLDGWGIRAEREGNAIALASTPNWDRLWAHCPNSLLQASGEAVGLQPGQMGNSDVGHLNLGAGRVVYQDLVCINRAIENGQLQTNPALQGAFSHVSETPGRTLHLVGLLSDGGVHSHQEHLHALLEYAVEAGITSIAVHCFLDGRDVPPRSAERYLRRLREKLDELGCGRVATVMGRYYAMDRDERWQRTAAAYRALVCGEGRRASSALEAVEVAYQKGENDEFVQPTVVTGEDQHRCTANTTISAGDAVVAFNFRADRMRQLTRALTEPDFEEFSRCGGLKGKLHYVSMARYNQDFDFPVILKRPKLRHTLGEWVSQHGLTQLRIAETEKFAHVTFFFNGGEERVFSGEERCLIPSPDVDTYDLKPEMSAYEVTDEVIERLEVPGYDVVVLNYANCDMVGHTGELEAAVEAVEHVDRCLGRVVEAVRSRRGMAIIVGDHGNAEQMRDPLERQQHTAHTSNPVPCVLVGNGGRKGRSLQLSDGVLANVAPTMLELLGLPTPPEMTAASLIVSSSSQVPEQLGGGAS